MQGLVDSLANSRKHHIEIIENTTMKDLQQMVRVYIDWLQINHCCFMFRGKRTTSLA